MGFIRSKSHNVILCLEFRVKKISQYKFDSRHKPGGFFSSLSLSRTIKQQSFFDYFSKRRTVEDIRSS